MKAIIGGTALMLLVSTNGFGQSFQIPDRIEKLGAKAKDSVNITLDGPLLQLAGQFMGANEQSIKAIISSLKAIHVRTFEFDRGGEFSDADIEPVRTQLRSGWARIIDMKDGDERVEVYVKQDKEKLGGLVLLATERKELSIIHIDGPIDLRQLSQLSGHLGIPAGVIPNVAGGAARPTPEAQPQPAPSGGGKKDGDE